MSTSALKPKTASSTSPDRRQAIAKRLEQMPESYRNVYRKAVSGKSKAAGLKSFCLECVGWQRNEITACSDEGCPLWPYRPYRSGSRAPQDVP